MGYKLAIFGTVAVLIQSISAQCISNLNGLNRFGGVPYSNPGTFGNLSPGRPGPGFSGPSSSGGSFAVTSASPVSPSGVSVLAENLAIEGPLSVGGNLPFLGTVGIEGAMPNVGAGAVSYGCGSGNVGILSESSAGYPGPYGLAGSPIGSPIAPIGASISPVSAPISYPGSFGSLNAPAPLGLSRSLANPVANPFGSSFGNGLGFNGFNGLRR